MRRQLLAVTTLLVAGAACGSILGIDFPPLRDDGASSDAGDSGLAPMGDSGPGHAFFSGFEDGGIGEWKAPPGYSNPVLYNLGNPALNELAVASGGDQSANRLRVRLEYETSTKGAFLAHRIPLAAFGNLSRLEGARLEIFLKLEKLDVEAGGPVEDAGAALLGGLLNAPNEAELAGGKLFGPILLVTNDDVYLAVVADLFNGGQTSALSQVTIGVDGGAPKLSLARFVNASWIGATIYSGSRERAIALAYPCAPKPEAPWVFAGSIGGNAICIDAANYDIKSIANAATLVIGSLLKGTGGIAISYDNVTVDVFFRP